MRKSAGPLARRFSVAYPEDAGRLRVEERVRKRYNSSFVAAVAQLVERNLAKVEVESSRLFCRSSIQRGKSVTRFPPLRIQQSTPGGVAEWSCSGLQSRE